ncbi:hypothetical protein CLV36_11368 [Laceyella sediminis]|uniref:Helicase-like protein n=1 Tax=Laceyella sediminis TaxID=573074 RepID=A0ABX5EPL7_9BACL|nr:hypothetical protein CLV36_11368 [Laceyella sediminis]
MFYSDNESKHAAVINRQSFQLTKDGITEAVRRRIPIRVGIISMVEDQRVEQAKQMFIDLDVNENKIGYDNLRQVGRGVRDAQPVCGRWGVGGVTVRRSLALCFFQMEAVG